LNSIIFLPKTIKVGYQSRSDTYTGQLAYVIYYDQRNVLRKKVGNHGETIKLSHKNSLMNLQVVLS